MFRNFPKLQRFQFGATPFSEYMEIICLITAIPKEIWILLNLDAEIIHVTGMVDNFHILITSTSQMPFNIQIMTPLYEAETY